MIRVVIELMEPMKEVPLINLACGLVVSQDWRDQCVVDS